MELKGLAPYLTTTKNIQALRFQGGLQPRIYLMVTHLQIKDFQKMFHPTLIVEAMYGALATPISSKRKRAGPYAASGSSNKRRVIIGMSGGKDTKIGERMPILLPVW